VILRGEFNDRWSPELPESRNVFVRTDERQKLFGENVRTEYKHRYRCFFSEYHAIPAIARVVRVHRAGERHKNEDDNAPVRKESESPRGVFKYAPTPVYVYVYVGRE